MGRITEIIDEDDLYITLEERYEHADLEIWIPTKGDVNKKKEIITVEINKDVAIDIIATLREISGVE